MKVYVSYRTSKKGKKYLCLAVGDATNKTIVTFDMATILKVAGALLQDVYLNPDIWFEILC